MSKKVARKVSKKAVVDENTEFKPSKEFSKQARVRNMAEYRRMHTESIEKPALFWGREAKELRWQKQWDKVLDWKAPNAASAKWYSGAKVNICENCVDRHVDEGRGNKAAIIWEGEPGDKRVITYRQLLRDVSRFANGLLAEGIKAKDRVLIYMPMTPEATVAMLACARIGAVHSVVFGGFSAESIKDRLEDSEAVAVITCDGGWRRGGTVELKQSVDEALKGNKTVKTVIVQKRAGNDVTMKKGRDKWWSDMVEGMSGVHKPKGFASEHPLFILYTSGSTGKPKGILHTTGGYMVGTYSTCKYIFDMKEDDVYWCTADVGWITGHSYITYGPLLNGVTQVMYEGAPNYPDWSRFWSIVEEYGVTIFYTAPTAIRAFIKAGDEHVDKHDLSSLRLLGTVGEPINPAAWLWYHEKIGGSRCPIVDTWWQTETGAIMISPLPGCTPTKPGSATQPFFGIDAVILDEDGNECKAGTPGKLVVRKPWPSMLRNIYGDRSRYKKTYWSDYKGCYTAGDGAVRDRKGNISIVGRLDDVLNVSGHRLGTAEVESALVAHEAVAEAAVVGKPHDIKGEAIVCFVTLKGNVKATEKLKEELRNHVGIIIGAIAKPDAVHFAAALPKTRSGKIMRRLLKELVKTGKVTGNVTTLEDSKVIEALQESIK